MLYIVNILQPRLYNQEDLKIGLAATNQKTSPHPIIITMAAVTVSKYLFHYSLSVEQLQGLCLDDIIITTVGLFVVTKESITFTNIHQRNNSTNLQ